MDPIRLYMKDFCSHSETEFSFEDFSSALIIGKIKGNERFSNASGKSTVFNAIEYVLFNEVQFSTLERIIRKGCDSCLVEMDFLSSLDNSIYRVKRTNSKKSGTDVRLFKKNGEDWEDLTQRRTSDTEKEIVKVIGFNYKVFCASSLFVQPGAENNVQKDFGNMPALTVEKRKAVLREILQLNVYTGYEKIAKQKYSSLNIDLEKNMTLISALGEPEEDIKRVTSQIIEIESAYAPLLSKRDDARKNLEDKQMVAAKIRADYENINSKKNFFQGKLLETNQNLERNKKNLASLKERMVAIPESGKAISAQVKEWDVEISSMVEEVKKLPEIQKLKDETHQELTKVSAEMQFLTIQIKEKSKPLPEDPECALCHQAVSNEHRHAWQEKVDGEIKDLDAKWRSQNVMSILLIANKEKLKLEINDLNEKTKKIASLENSKSLANKDLELKRAEYKQLLSSLEELKVSIEEKKKEKESLEKELSQFNVETLEKNKQELVALDSEISSVRFSEKGISDSINKISADKAVLNHKIGEFKLSIKRIEEMKLSIKEIQKSLEVYARVSEAFSSGGIPSLIVHSILDEFQEEANKWLNKLHPGIQLQFVITKDNSKKQQEDTLDILYFVGGNEMEYKQLSGAQKMLVSLSIKLAMIFIMNKKLGVSVKLMLLDEVDQPLDPGTAEIFADAIKVLHKDIKILAITHNPELKHKFSHAVVVDQDENNVSTAKLVNW